MTITSLQFAGFLVFVLAIYYFLSRKLQNAWLLLASYFFYISWDWHFALTLILLTGANYVIGLELRKVRKNQPGLLWMGITLNVFALMFFKFADFFVPELVIAMSQVGILLRSESLQIILPIGLSFRVLENISYLVDIYNEQTNPAKNFISFSLYSSYFPKMLAGPIERARSFLPKLAEDRIVTNETLARSFGLIIIGLVRKLVVADSLSASITARVFITPSLFPAPELLAWLFVYSFALYNDFAGYTSIMRGVSGLFGIDLSANFNLPYFAQNFNEFWNRWHITLSNWLRDYLFFPLRRAIIKKNLQRMNWITLVFPPMITMLVSGLWHGISLNMLLWGGLHGFYLIIFQRTKQSIPMTAVKQTIWRQTISTAVVFLLVSLAWVTFRMELPIAVEYWRGLLALSTYEELIIHTRLFLRLFFVMLFLIPVIGLDWLQYRYKDELFFFRWPRTTQSLLLAAALFLIFIVNVSNSGTAFVYQGF